MGIIFYGPPAAGKDTVTTELMKLDQRYQLFKRLKAGGGRTRGYRMVEASYIEALRTAGQIVWENHRYDAVYVVDKASLAASLSVEVPIIHLGQIAAVQVVSEAIPDARWLRVALWCPRDVAVKRLVGRGATDLDQRIAAWDETLPLHDSDIFIDTAEVAAVQAARMVAAAASARGVDGTEPS